MNESLVSVDVIEHTLCCLHQYDEAAFKCIAKSLENLTQEQVDEVQSMYSYVYMLNVIRKGKDARALNLIFDSYLYFAEMKYYHVFWFLPLYAHKWLINYDNMRTRQTVALPRLTSDIYTCPAYVMSDYKFELNVDEACQSCIPLLHKYIGTNDAIRLEYPVTYKYPPYDYRIAQSPTGYSVSVAHLITNDLEFAKNIPMSRVKACESNDDLYELLMEYRNK